MAEQILMTNKKKSEINAKNRFDYEKLIHKSVNFIPCSYEEKEEEVIFCYECDYLICSSNLKKEDRLSQLQFLVNFLKLYDLYVEYKIPFSAANIYYDENYIPCIKERDLYGEGENPTETQFLFIYKTFVAAVLGSKYTVAQLQDSGLEILEQEAELKEYMSAKTKEELVKLLRRERKNFFENQKNSTVRITKKENFIKNIVLVSAPIMIIVLISLLVYYVIFLIPYQKSIVIANEAYVQKNYVKCIDSMEEIDVENMNVNTKFILAYSYAKSESLAKDEIDLLTSRLSINSNEKELEYWIYLGRLEMKQAESLALSLSDDKLLIYAYLKELNQLQSNTSIEGQEKQARISELEDAIQTLGDKYAPEEDSESVTTEEIEAESTEGLTTETITTEIDTKEVDTSVEEKNENGTEETKNTQSEESASENKE